MQADSGCRSPENWKQALVLSLGMLPLQAASRLAPTRLLHQDGLSLAHAAANTCTEALIKKTGSPDCCTRMARISLAYCLLLSVSRGRSRASSHLSSCSRGEACLRVDWAAWTAARKQRSERRLHCLPLLIDRAATAGATSPHLGLLHHLLRNGWLHLNQVFDDGQHVVHC